MRRTVVPTTLLAVIALGCGGGDRRAEVTGKVSVAGKGALSGGMITFVSTTDPNRVSSGTITSEGTYRVGDAPVGPCKVMVDNSHLDPAVLKKSAGGMPMVGAGPGSMAGMKGAPGALGRPSGSSPEIKAKMGAPPKTAGSTAEMGKSDTADQKFLKIDKSFASPESTTLTATVNDSGGTIDFEVKQ